MLAIRAKAHDVLDSRAVVPTAIEDDNFTRGGKVLHVALEVHLSLFTVRWSGKGHHAEYTRADTLRERPNRATLSRTVAAFKHDDNAHVLVLDPLLELAQFPLKSTQFLFVFLAVHVRRRHTGFLIFFRNLSSLEG